MKYLLAAAHLVEDGMDSLIAEQVSYKNSYLIDQEDIETACRKHLADAYGHFDESDIQVFPDGTIQAYNSLGDTVAEYKATEMIERKDILQ